VRRAPRAEHGVVLVTVALFLPVLALFLVFVLDVGNWWVHKRHLQMQADAAALAGGGRFAECLSTAQSGTAYANMQDEAARYAGATDAVWNPQVGGANRGPVTVLFNSQTFAVGGPGPDDTVPGNACDSMMFDVKLTEADLPLFFGGIAGFDVVPAVNARARVELQKVRQEAGVRPIAVRDDSAYRCADALFVDDFTGAVLQTVPLTTRTTLPDLTTQFSNPGGAPVAMPAGPHLGVRVRLGDCAGNSETYADPVGGVSFVNVYSTGSAGGDPLVRSVSLPPGLSNCTPDPYFSTNACTLVVKAYVSFAAGAITSGPSQNVFVRINGGQATAASDAGGTYWTASFSVAWY